MSDWSDLLIRVTKRSPDEIAFDKAMEDLRMRMEDWADNQRKFYREKKDANATKAE